MFAFCAQMGMIVDIAGEKVEARPAGTLHWPAAALLAVADLHLGKAGRLARAGAGLLPPYETADTLARLAAEVAATRPRTVICLGDSFDDLAAAEEVAEAVVGPLAAMAAGRRWIWIAGNHDPGPVGMPGTHRAEHREGPLVFRHIAAENPGEGEISGHYHPKARLMARGRAVTRRCFLADAWRVILPAFGTYTGGLDIGAAVFDRLLGPEARVLMLGDAVHAIPRARMLAES